MVSAACVRLMSLASLTFETLPQRAGLLVLGQSESEAKVAPCVCPIGQFFPIAHV